MGRFGPQMRGSERDCAPAFGGSGTPRCRRRAKARPSGAGSARNGRGEFARTISAAIMAANVKSQTSRPRVIRAAAHDEHRLRQGIVAREGDV